MRCLGHQGYPWGLRSEPRNLENVEQLLRPLGLGSPSGLVLSLAKSSGEPLGALNADLVSTPKLYCHRQAHDEPNHGRPSVPGTQAGPIRFAFLCSF